MTFQCHFCHSLKVFKLNIYFFVVASYKDCFFTKLQFMMTISADPGLGYLFFFFFF